MLDVKSPSTLSLAVAPSFVKLEPITTFRVSPWIKVITGGVISIILTVLITSEALEPSESVTLYVIWYIPINEVFTLPEITIFSVKSPSSKSTAVAPSSS